jgi:hypothetical protein
MWNGEQAKESNTIWLITHGGVGERWAPMAHCLGFGLVDVTKCGEGRISVRARDFSSVHTGSDAHIVFFSVGG